MKQGSMDRKKKKKKAKEPKTWWKRTTDTDEAGYIGMPLSMKVILQERKNWISF